MRAIRKADIRRLATEVYNLEGRTLEGILRRDPVDGKLNINGVSLEEWLARDENKEVSLLLIPAESEHPMETQTCNTCGRQYTGASCPHCREVRYRLRGG
ncbi:MAG TPA: hypothetical protein PLQ85_12770 [Anaerolineae bacterium]|nr:hypothetical protein [Anaerolineae bacterium]